MISIPITLEQLIVAVKQLPPQERVQVAQALLETELKTDLKSLLQEFYAQPPIEDVSDADILAEVNAVRQQP